MLLSALVRNGDGPDCDAESGMHCVLYDDGEEYWEELGGALAPWYCLEGWHEE